MLFKRAKITSYGNELDQRAAAGSGEIGNVAVKSITADANATLTVADLSGGAVLFTAFSAGRTIAVPTAAAMLAASPDMDIGDSFAVTLSIQTAFVGTYAASAGITYAGKATIAASSSAYCVVTKTSSTTMIWTSL